ncbi:hypothetical protein AAFF_G00212810 [Aldrovandia affinis]|uniref:AIMP2 lysyl-tRNA synthetase binding domain-containing protein n=1 Tax=Aldrovandia affinis TaxID=143900 RepID=A0AAD7RHI1_9TELE|nr:hypothetical protein AAFF_G00212810 [Aldrovandia affinis]
MPMYQVKPTSGADVKIEIPTCMYKLPNVHTPRGSSGEHAHQSDEMDPGVQALEARQDEILRRLYELKAAVDGLAKTVTTPDADLDATTIPQQGGASEVLTGTADLDSLLGKDPGALRDIVINAHPRPPPVPAGAARPAVPKVPGPLHVPKTQMQFNVRSMCRVEGEGNVARFLFGLLGAGPRDPVAVTLSDGWVDTALVQLAEGGAKERATVLRALNGALGRGPWLAGAELSLADIVCACCVLQCSAPSAPPNVQHWLKACRPAQRPRHWPEGLPLLTLGHILP